jgi:hypothetical protein
MRIERIAVNVLLALLVYYGLMARPAVANTIVSVTGADDGAEELGEDEFAVIEAGWTIPTTYENVDIIATFSSIAGTGADITAYLTTQIGPGATSAAQVTAPVTLSLVAAFKRKISSPCRSWWPAPTTWS